MKRERWLAALLLLGGVGLVPGGGDRVRSARAVGNPDSELAAAGIAEAAPLADLAWIAGSWRLQIPGEYLDEQWSPPVGNSMIGHFRWVRGDSLWITEHLSITAESDTVVFRLRHFSNQMAPWEEAEDPFVYLLTERGEERVTFELPEPRPDRPSGFVYQALPGDSLLVRIEREQDGETVTQDFRYGRAPW